jgi:hypothetical protein
MHKSVLEKGLQQSIDYTFSKFRGMFRVMAKILRYVLLGIFVLGVVGAFIAMFAEPFAAEFYRQLGVDSSKWVAPVLAFLTQWWVSGTLAFLSGVAVGAWLHWGAAKFDANRPRKPSARTEFLNESVRIADLVGNSPLLSDRSFKRCVIEGPAFLKAQQNCTLLFAATPTTPAAAAFTTAAEGGGILGAILMVGVEFEECFFDRVAFIGTPDDAQALTPAFHTESRQACAERVGYDGKGASTKQAQ